jgi:vacuolar-type H+-ATPase subunit F/Vma7
MSALDAIREKVTGEKDDISELKKKLQYAKTSQARFLSTWELNRSFYAGDQWVYWNKTKIERPVLEPESVRVLLVDNRIIGIVRTEIAKMSKQRPTFTVIPTTAEQEDVKASETGERILDFLWKHLGLSVRLEEALLWSRVCAAGFWKVVWDSGGGKKFGIVVDEDENPVINEDTGKPHQPEDFDEMPEGMSAKTIATGDVHVEVVSPFEIYPDPLAKVLDECEWLIQVSIQSKDFVKQRYNVEMEPDANITPGTPEVRLPIQVESGQTYKGIKVFEYWEKASADCPQGRHCVWAKETILEDTPNPYKHLPYVMFRSIQVPGRFWGSSVTEQLRGPQTELNKIKSQIIENAQRIGNPSILIPATSNTKISGVPGEEIRYDDASMNSRPEYLRPPDMPAYVIEQINRIEASMQEISGQHEVSQAQVPPGVKAASAINLLQEADDTRLGPAIAEMEVSLGKAGTMLLEVVAEYWTDERVVMIAGENHQLDAIHFKGAALKENTQVECQTGSMLPQSKAARQAAIQDFLALAFQYEGQAMNPRFLAKTLKDLDAGALAKFYGDLDQDEGQINRENQELAQEQVVKLHVYDNTQLHIEGHTEWQRSAGYASLPPMAKNLAELHVREHREHLLNQIGPPKEEKHDPVETLAYKDAPPDIKRQIEKQAGMEPSEEEPTGTPPGAAQPTATKQPEPQGEE